MQPSRLLAISIVSLSVVLLALTPAKKSPPVRLTGTWNLVRVDNVLPDGARVQLYGANPQGRLVFDESGRYSIQIYREGRARFASKDKNAGTAEENRDAVQGCTLVDDVLTYTVPAPTTGTASIGEVQWRRAK